MIKNLVIGNGEIGSAIGEILWDCKVVDIEGTDEKCEFLHIAFPYSDNFIEEVEKYKAKHEPKMTIIHSTVPVGTSRKCDAVHSPVRGPHPHLREALDLFPKWFGGARQDQMNDIFQMFTRVEAFDKQETTEAMKLWDTAQYAWNVVLMKEIYKWCKENDLNFYEIYTLPNVEYNNCYLELKRPEVVRPYLKYIRGRIGGHCLIPNAKLLPTWITKIILEKDDEFDTQ